MSQQSPARRGLPAPPWSPASLRAAWRLLAPILGVASVLAAAAPAHAVLEPLTSASLTIVVGNSPPIVLPWNGLGSPALTETSISGLRAGIFDFTGTIPVTDPNAFPITGFSRVAVSNGAGGFSFDSAGHGGGAMPLRGTLNICFFAPCASTPANIQVPFSSSGTNGVGLGGAPIATSGFVKTTVNGNPWTTGIATVGALSKSGTPFDGTSVTLVTPIVISTDLGGRDLVLPAIARLFLAFGGSDDPDLDGIPAFSDNCKLAPNPDQTDADGDAVGDACDRCPAAPDPEQRDADQDGAGDACDNCQGLANADQRDTDQDGAGDACDNCVATSNALQADTDADGAGDACDNCTLVRNGPLLGDSGGNVQRDTDQDGCGNVCDPDLNNDGIVNFVDLAALKARFFSRDPDADLDGSQFVSYSDLSLLKRRLFQAPGPSGIASRCVPEAPPCTEAELTPLLLCGSAACSDPGSPASCVVAQCGGAYDQMTARCRGCVDALAEPVAALWLDRAVSECIH